MARHQPELLGILRGASPALQGNKAVAAFLSRVLDDEERLDLMPPRRPPLPGEEAFWWCIEQLLLLCDLARPPNDPYLLMLVDDLRAFADLVERRAPLPPGYRLDWTECEERPNSLKMPSLPQRRAAGATPTPQQRSKAMKLYDTQLAPNPRRVRIFMAEKGISCETIQVNIVKGENLSKEYLAINPRGVVPTLVLDDGTAIDESVAIFHYLEETHPEPPLMGTDPLSKARIASRERHMEIDGMWSAAEVFRNAHPAFAKRGIPGNQGAVDAIPPLVERGRGAVLRFYRRLDEALGASAFVAGDQFSAADITGLCAVDFAARFARVPVPEDCGNLQRWHQVVLARPSAGA